MIGRLATLLASTAFLFAAPADAEVRGLRFDEGRGLRSCYELHGLVDLAAEGHGELRQGPGDQYLLLGRLAPASRGIGGRVPVEIVSTFDGWLEVRGPAVEVVLARAPSDGEHAPQTAWLLGIGVTTEVDSPRAFSFPRTSSQAVVQSLDGRPLTSHARLADIVACDNMWVFGRWELSRTRQLRYLRELEIWSDPVRVEAWTPHRSSFPDRDDERRALGDWLAESYGEEELSRAIRVSRVVGPLAFEYYASFWHGNRGPYFQVSVRRDDALCGEEDWRRDESSDVWRPEPDVAAAARDARARMAAAFETCGTTAEETAAALAGFERAFAAAAPWAEQDRRHVLAVSRAIADYGAEPEQP